MMSRSFVLHPTSDDYDERHLCRVPLTITVPSEDATTAPRSRPSRANGGSPTADRHPWEGRLHVDRSLGRFLPHDDDLDGVKVGEEQEGVEQVGPAPGQVRPRRSVAARTRTDSDASDVSADRHRDGISALCDPPLNHPSQSAALYQTYFTSSQYHRQEVTSRLLLRLEGSMDRLRVMLRKEGVNRTDKDGMDGSTNGSRDGESIMEDGKDDKGGKNVHKEEGKKKKKGEGGVYGLDMYERRHRVLTLPMVPTATDTATGAATGKVGENNATAGVARPVARGSVVPTSSSASMAGLGRLNNYGMTTVEEGDEKGSEADGMYEYDEQHEEEAGIHHQHHVGAMMAEGLVVAEGRQDNEEEEEVVPTAAEETMEEEEEEEEDCDDEAKDDDESDSEDGEYYYYEEEDVVHNNVEIMMSDVGLIYANSGLARTDIVAEVRDVLYGTGESEELVEIAMSYLDRYLMAKAGPTNLVFTDFCIPTDPALDSVQGIHYAAMACLHIAVKTHSPHGDRGDRRHECIPSELWAHAEANPGFLDHFYPFQTERAHVIKKENMADMAAIGATIDYVCNEGIPYTYVTGSIVNYILHQGPPRADWEDIRRVLVQTETDVLYTLQFRLYPTTSFGAAHSLIDVVLDGIQIDRLAQVAAEEEERRRQSQRQEAIYYMASCGTREDEDDDSEDKVHRLADPNISSPGTATATRCRPRLPVYFSPSRLLKLVTDQLVRVQDDDDLLSVPRSVLARAAVQAALLQMNEETRAAYFMSMMPRMGNEANEAEAQAQAQYEAGLAAIDRQATILRKFCSEFNEEEYHHEDPDEVYEEETEFRFALHRLQTHLNAVMTQELLQNLERQTLEQTYQGTAVFGNEMEPMPMTSPPLGPKQTPRVVTPAASLGPESSSGDASPKKKTKTPSKADSALDFASERLHQAKKARKTKEQGGVARLYTGHSPGYGGNITTMKKKTKTTNNIGRAILK